MEKKREKSIFTDVMNLVGSNKPLPQAQLLPLEMQATFPDLSASIVAMYPLIGFYTATTLSQFDQLLAFNNLSYQSALSHFADPLKNCFFSQSEPHLTPIHETTTFRDNTASIGHCVAGKSTAWTKSELQPELSTDSPINLSADTTGGECKSHTCQKSSHAVESDSTSLTLAPRFPCSDCGRSYSTVSGLAKHRQFHCATRLQRLFACKHCAKQYRSVGALKMHVRTHTLPCQCHVCGKAFSRPWLLQGHLRTHTGEKPFQCCHCGRAFADRSNLRAHLQTHSDVKKYRCAVCRNTFSRVSLLAKHQSRACPIQSGVSEPHYDT